MQRDIPLKRVFNKILTDFTFYRSQDQLPSTAFIDTLANRFPLSNQTKSPEPVPQYAVSKDLKITRSQDHRITRYSIWFDF